MLDVASVLVLVSNSPRSSGWVRSMAVTDTCAKAMGPLTPPPLMAMVSAGSVPLSVSVSVVSPVSVLSVSSVSVVSVSDPLLVSVSPVLPEVLPGVSSDTCAGESESPPPPQPATAKQSKMRNKNVLKK